MYFRIYVTCVCDLSVYCGIIEVGGFCCVPFLLFVTVLNVTLFCFITFSGDKAFIICVKKPENTDQLL